MNIVIFVTARNKSEAKKIAQHLLKERLIACANIVNGVTSLFRWKGKVDQAEETLLILKTEKSKFKKIVKSVNLLHSYETVEVIALPIVDGDTKYLQWVKDSVS